MNSCVAFGRERQESPLAAAVVACCDPSIIPEWNFIHDPFSRSSIYYLASLACAIELALLQGRVWLVACDAHEVSGGGGGLCIRACEQKMIIKESIPFF